MEGNATDTPTDAPEPASDEPKFVVGDIVRGDFTAGKPFWDDDCQVTKVTAKTVQVIMLTGKKRDATKSFRHAQVKLVQPSNLRKTAPSGRKPSAASASSSAAAAPSDASAASAPGTASAADAPDPEVDLEKDREETRRLARTLMESDEESQQGS